MKNKRISLFILIILTLSLFGSSPEPVHAQDWWNNNWSYRIMIEIDRNKIQGDFVDFPVLVYLNSSKINWSHVQDDLRDLRFIDGDDITQLYAELENYTVNSEAWIWVKLPNIWMTIGEPNQSFYLYYGNNAVSSWWNTEDVWEDSAVMVQHMVDNPDNAHIMDSTRYSNDGTKKGANEPIETASGKIDSAQQFDGIDDFTSHGDPVSLRLATTDFTISAWIKRVSGAWTILSKGYGAHNWGSGYVLRGTNPIYFDISDTIGTEITIISGAYSDNVLTHIAVVADRDGNGQIYINGSASGTPVDISSKPDITTTEPFYIGWYGGATDFKGIIDEVSYL